MAQGAGRQANRDADGGDQDSLDGAERAGQLLGAWGSRVGRGIATAAVRVREEVEDIFAEAQSIRRGERD